MSFKLSLVPSLLQFKAPSISMTFLCVNSFVLDLVQKAPTNAPKNGQAVDDELGHCCAGHWQIITSLARCCCQYSPNPKSMSVMQTSPTRLCTIWTTCWQRSRKEKFRHGGIGTPPFSSVEPRLVRCLPFSSRFLFCIESLGNACVKTLWLLAFCKSAVSTSRLTFLSLSELLGMHPFMREKHLLHLDAFAFYRLLQAWSQKMRLSGKRKKEILFFWQQDWKYGSSKWLAPPFARWLLQQR